MIYVDSETDELSMTQCGSFIWYDCSLDNLSLIYYPIISHLYFKYNQYYLIYAVRLQYNNIFKYIISLIPIDINII